MESVDRRRDGGWGHDCGCWWKHGTEAAPCHLAPNGQMAINSLPGDAPLGQHCSRFMLPMGESIRRHVVPRHKADEEKEAQAGGQKVTPCTV